MKHRESEIQQACVRWFYYQYPNYAKALIKIPNEGKRSLRLGHISEMDLFEPKTTEKQVNECDTCKYQGTFSDLCDNCSDENDNHEPKPTKKQL